MLLTITLLAVGFAGGVLATGLVACQLFGLLHARAVRAVDENCGLFGGVTLRTQLPVQAPPVNWPPLKDVGP